MSDETVHRGYHCAWHIHYYHIVFPVKYRKALFDKEVTTIIMETAEAITECYVIEMEAIGADRDHIHLLLSSHPRVAPGRIVHISKSITARELLRNKPTVKRELWGGESWTGVYSFATVGERADWETAENYVQNQGYLKVELRQLKLLD